MFFEKNIQGAFYIEGIQLIKNNVKSKIFINL